jgi:DNA-binding SARP family transcriptional activator
MDRAGDLRLSVLGELRGSRGGAPVELGGRRQRAVLAALIIARGDAVLGDRLADCIWGEQPPANAPATLQSYVSHLRRRLEPHAAARTRDGIIVKVGPGYAIRLGLEAVDAWRFEGAVASASTLPPAEAAAVLDEALGLWQGPAYLDYGDEEWAQAEITRLDELRAVAREQLLQARLDLGGSTLLVPELEALVADDPLREERWRLLVLGLYRAQRPRAACPRTRGADAITRTRRRGRRHRDRAGGPPLGPTGGR